MERDKNATQVAPKPVEVILSNRARLADKLGVEEVFHTPPSMDHYPHLYPWDEAAAGYILTHFGYHREAVKSLFSIFIKQRPDGMVPNQQRVPGLRGLDMELLTFTNPSESADYSQPPIWCISIEALYEAKKIQDPNDAKLFLETILPMGVRSLDYFTNFRRTVPGKHLIFNVKGEETGRDNDEALNGYAPKLPSKGPDTPYLTELINAGSHYFGRLALGGLHKINGWDPQKIKKYYAAIDPMFNAIYADALRRMGGLAGELDDSRLARRLTDEALAVEEEIISDLFIPEANEGKGTFLVRNNSGPKDEISVSGVGPLLLENLPATRLESILDMMDDHLDAPYPLSTLSTKSRHYDPEGRRPHNVWNGDVMMISNWLGVLGLRKQAYRAAVEFVRPDLSARCLSWSENRIIPRSKQLLDQGYYESFSSQTGKPRRARTIKNFVWNGLIETL